MHDILHVVISFLYVHVHTEYVKIPVDNVDGNLQLFENFYLMPSRKKRMWCDGCRQGGYMYK